MKYINQIIVAVILVVMLSNCDNRDKDFFKSNASTFAIKLSSSLSDSSIVVTEDSVKLSAISIKQSSIVYMDLGKSTSDKKLSISCDKTFDAFINKSAYTSDILLLNGKNEIDLFPKVVGDNIFNLSIKDVFGNESKYTYIIHAFNNLNPVPSFSVTSYPDLNEREYIIDASTSYDMDKKFGGTIKLYTYTIGEKVISTKNPTIKYIFPSSGNYEISVGVTDNDNITITSPKQSYSITSTTFN